MPMYSNKKIELLRKKALAQWVEMARKRGEEEWKACLTAFQNGEEQILNGFDFPWSNGLIEGSHNRMKTIKGISFVNARFSAFPNKNTPGIFQIRTGRYMNTTKVP